MRPWRATNAARQAFFLAAPFAAILPGASASGSALACEQNDATRRRSAHSCEYLKSEGFCNRTGILGSEARETCRLSCGLGCGLPCRSDDASRRRSGWSCQAMFDGGFCGSDGNLGHEMGETCRTTCYQAIGCLPPCKPDHSSRRRSEWSCKELRDEGFCGVDGNLGVETRVTCRTTCHSAFGCVPPTCVGGGCVLPTADDDAHGEHSTTGPADRDPPTAADSRLQAISIAAVIVPLGACFICCCTVCICARFCWTDASSIRASLRLRGLHLRINPSRVTGRSLFRGGGGRSLFGGGRPAAGKSYRASPAGAAQAEPVAQSGTTVCSAAASQDNAQPVEAEPVETTLQEAVQQAATTTEAAKLEPLEGTPAADTATSMDSVFVSVHEEEDADEPDPKQLKKKKKRVKKPARAVSFHAADQVETIDDGGGDDDDDDGEEEHRPKCPKCQQDMCWSDYSGPPYDTKYGWGCMNRDTCHNWKENCGRYRWNCRQCSEDMCEACSGLQNPAPAKRGVLSMWQPGEKIVEDTEEDDDARPGADAPARSRSFGSIINPCMADAGPRRTDASGASLFGNNGEQAEQQEAAGKRRTFFASIFSRIEESEGQEEQQEAAGKRRSLFASVFSSKEDQEGAAARPRPSVLGAVLQGSKTAVETRGQEAEQHEPVVVGAVIVEEPDKSEQERRPSNGSASSSSGSSSGGQQKS